MTDPEDPDGWHSSPNEPAVGSDARGPSRDPPHCRGCCCQPATRADSATDGQRYAGGDILKTITLKQLMLFYSWIRVDKKLYFFDLPKSLILIDTQNYSVKISVNVSLHKDLEL